MASPSSTAYLRPDLGMSFEEYDLVAEAQGFVGGMVLPTFDTQLQNANFGKLPIEELIRDTRTQRAPGGAYNRDLMTFEQDSYTCVEHGAEEPVDDREKAIYAHILDAEQVAANRARARVLRAREKRIADAVLNTTTWTGAALTTAVGTAWSDAANATPVADVADAMKKARLSGGVLPNTVIMSWTVFCNLRQCDEIIDRIKFSGLDDPKTRGINPQMLAALFAVENVVVAGALRNTAAQGATLALGDIWNNDRVMVAKVATGNDLREVCIGRTFHYVGDGSTAGATVEQYRDESKRSDIIRAREDTDEKIIYPQAGHLLTGVA